MLHRYAEWTRRRANTTQCSPALAAGGVLIAFAIVCYVYREVILKTVEVMVVAITGAVIVAGAVALIVSSLRYYRAHAAILRAESEPVPDTWTRYAEPATTTLSDEEAITAEADWLASGVELAFGPDGKTLKAK